MERPQKRHSNIFKARSFVAEGGRALREALSASRMTA